MIQRRELNDEKEELSINNRLVQVQAYTDKGEIESIAETSDGLIVSGSRDGTAKIWKVSGLCICTLRAHSDWVYSVLVLPDGLIATGYKDGTVRVWGSDKARQAFYEVQSLQGHTGSVRALCSSLDGRVISASWDETIRVWGGCGDCHQILTGEIDPYA